MILSNRVFSKLKEELEPKIREKELINTNQVFELLGIPENKRNHQLRIKIGCFLNKLGWEPHRIKGLKNKCYLNVEKLKEMPIQEYLKRFNFSE